MFALFLSRSRQQQHRLSARRFRFRVIVRRRSHEYVRHLSGGGWVKSLSFDKSNLLELMNVKLMNGGPRLNDSIIYPANRPGPLSNSLARPYHQPFAPPTPLQFDQQFVNMPKSLITNKLGIVVGPPNLTSGLLRLLLAGWLTSSARFLSSHVLGRQLN